MHHHKADEASHVCVCVAIDISTILSVERFCFLRKKIPPFADEIETKVRSFFRIGDTGVGFLEL